MHMLSYHIFTAQPVDNKQAARATCEFVYFDKSAISVNFRYQPERGCSASLSSSKEFGTSLISYKSIKKGSKF